MPQIISALALYKYVLLFPISIVEGPIITVIAGFLYTSGILNIYLAYVVIVLGDITGDAIWYTLGRWGSPLVDRYGPKIGLTKTKLEHVRTYYEKHRKKTLFLSKILLGIGFAGLIVAGSLKVPYRKFFLTCVVVSLTQAFILMIVGIVFGQAYMLIGKYLNYYAATVAILAVVLCVGMLIKRFGSITI